MQLQNDEHLFERIKTGDKKALETLFERYYVPLCDFAYQFLKSSDLSEEAVSDVFIKLWSNKLQIKLQSNLKAYLYRAVRNNSLNYLKKEDKNAEDISTLHSLTDSHHTADHPLLFSEFQKEFEESIDLLPERQKLVFRMNRLDGLKYKEIAEILGISIHTVQNHLVESVKTLSKKYSYFNTLKTLILLSFCFVSL